jgi:transketolase
MYNLLPELKKDKRGIRDMVAAALDAQMAADPRVCYLDADLMNCIGTRKLMAKYPTRAINCGIAESNMIGVAAGMSAAGMIPYAHTFGIFASRRVFDQAFLSVAYAKLNVRILGSDPGVTAALNGGTHMPFEDMAPYLAVPNAVLIDVCDCAQAASVMEQVKDMYGLIYIRFMRKNPTAVYADGQDFTVGKGALLREGSDITLMGSGIMVAETLKAADMLAAEGISARVIDMFTWKPIDKDLILDSAKKTGCIVTAENHNYLTGLGSQVAEVVTSAYPVPVIRVGVEDIFGEVGPESYLQKRFELTAEKVYSKAKEALAIKNAMK